MQFCPDAHFTDRAKNSHLKSVTQKPCVPTERRDAIWSAIQAEACETLDLEPWLQQILDPLLNRSDSLEDGVVHVVTGTLFTSEHDQQAFGALARDTLARNQSLMGEVRRDLKAIREYDPAATNFLTPFLFFKGWQALFAHRIAHDLWKSGRRVAASWIQAQASREYGVDIHPAAKLGSGIVIDHATGVVIGETAVVGNDVIILHEVTLGATGKDRGDRHPKVGQGVLLGAGAKVLGNIRIGEHARIGAGSTVLRDVQPGDTVAGVAAATKSRPAAKRRFIPNDSGRHRAEQRATAPSLRLGRQTPLASVLDYQI